MRGILILCAGVLLASTAIATAERTKLLVQFTGEWCLEDGDHESGQTYRFGPCLPTHKSDAGWLTVAPNGFAAHETSCKLVRAAADENSNYLVKFRCTGEGEIREQNYWMTLQMVMTPTDREP
jgi:hypothetical protein